MMRFPFIFVLFTFVLRAFTVSAQNETATWIFGNQAGLDFNSNPPAFINGLSYNSSNATACMSSTAGNLLFYSDGLSIYTASHVVMSNGSGLNGAGVPMAVRQPGSSNLYYLFYPGQSSTMQYAVIDMSLAAGQGSVITKNQVLAGSMSTRLSGAFHCNGADVWVVTHSVTGNAFNSYLLSSSGISGTVISTAGSAAMTGFVMKINPSGNRIAGCVNNGTSGFVEMYDFDRSTGIVSNGNSIHSNGVAVTDSEFSSDGTRLYATFPLAGIVQFNLCAGSASAVAASAYVLAGSNGVWSLERAGDGKIYCARNTAQGSLGVIEQPNLAGPACSYVHTGQLLTPASSYHTLPSFFPGYLGLKHAGLQDQTNLLLSCNSRTFTLPAPACASVGNYTSVYWNFGDPASGALNTSTQNNPSHFFTAPGNYLVKFVGQPSCNDTIFQKIAITHPTISVSGINAICPGTQLTLTATGAPSYTWNGSWFASQMVVQPTVTTVYTVATESASQDCSASNVFTVHVSPGLTVSPLNATLCAGDSVLLGATGASSYTWSSGQNNSHIFASALQNTLLVVSGLTGTCVSTATIPLNVTQQPQVSVSQPTALVCPGDTVILEASGAQTYWWNGQPGDSVFIAQPVSSLVYTVVGELSGCSGVQTVAVNVHPMPVVAISSSDTMVCAGTVVTLTASGALKYIWSTGDSTSVVQLAVTSLTAVSATGLDTNQCKASVIRSLDVFPPPVVSISGQLGLCRGASSWVVAGGASSFTWSQGMVGDSLLLTPLLDTVLTVLAIDTNFCASTHSVQVLVTDCSGIGEYLHSDLPQLVPQPAGESFRLRLVSGIEAELDLMSNTGQVIHRYGNYRSGQVLDLPLLPDGLYYLRVKCGNSPPVTIKLLHLQTR